MRRLDFTTTRNQSHLRRTYIERAIRSIADSRRLLRFVMTEDTPEDTAKQLADITSRMDGIVAALAQLIGNRPPESTPPEATQNGR